MDVYSAQESPAEARKDRSRQVLLPAAVVAWVAGGLLLLLSAAALVSVVLGGLADAPLHIVMVTDARLPVDAAPPDAHGAFVPESSAPTMTRVDLGIRGAAPAAAFAVRLAPALGTTTAGVVAVLAGVVLLRIEHRSATSPLLLAATAVLTCGSALAQLVAFAGAAGIGSVAWTGIPQITALADVGIAAFDPTPFAIAFGMLVVVHLLRRLEGSGVLVGPARNGRSAPRR